MLDVYIIDIYKIKFQLTVNLYYVTKFIFFTLRRDFKH